MNNILKHTLALLFTLLLPNATASSVWIEAESIAEQTPAAKTQWTNAELLSNKSALVLTIEKTEIENKIPKNGLLLRYPFSIETAGQHTLWNRLVFEKTRSPFQWRINGGTWNKNSQIKQPISNVQELAYWNPIGWTKMGTASLQAGKHTLEIRLTREYEDPESKTKPKYCRYISDALHITSSPFRPNYRFKPKDDYRNQQDRNAATHTFQFPANNTPRQDLDLSGLWQIAPYDEIEDFSEEARVSGVKTYPPVNTLNWYAYTVPGDKNTQLPAMRFAHRFVAKTSVNIPATLKNNSFQLTFESISMIASLFVNKQKIGDFNIVKGRWQTDISPFIRTGKKNEILLVIKDSYYALAADKNASRPNLRRMQYLPHSLFNKNQGTTRRLDFPAANGHGQAGLLDIVKLEANQGPAYVQNTFIKPFPITRKQIEIDTTIYNPSKSPLNGSVKQTIRTWPQGKTIATLPSKPFRVEAKNKKGIRNTTSSEPLTLWWIYDATLYELVTDLIVGGKTIDRSISRFGNREWEVRGIHFYLNGVKQHLRADTTLHLDQQKKQYAATAFEKWKSMGVNMIRQRFQDLWFERTPRELLNWADEVGMPVRQACGTFDGQIGSYNLINQDRTPRTGLFERWRAQTLNAVIARRNNPSVFIWELDNELIYINARNYGLSEIVEPEFTKASNKIMSIDPTRVTVIGGGAALLDESLPTYGIHYYEVEDRHYPNEAYTGKRALELEGSGKKARIWPVDFDKKPIFFSETAFLPGRAPSGFAAVGGEATFLGKSQSRAATGKIASWLAEGYRWKGYAGTHFWLDNDFTDGSYTDAWQPIAILRRHWKDTYASSEKVQRKLRLYNDLPNTAPITATWAIELNGKTILNGTKIFTVPPGTYQPWNPSFTMPKTTTRQKGFFRLSATRQDKQVYTRAIPIELLPESKPTPAKFAGPLIVWDPEGSTLKRLKNTGYTPNKIITSLQEIPKRFGLLVVGKNALSPKDATNRRWMTLTAAGNRIVFFEQNHPLHFQAVPSDHEPTEFDGTIAFSQNLNHPIFNGIQQNDLDFWGQNEIVYRHALRKPTKGAVSLIQVDDALAYSALLTTTVDEGLNVISQLAIAEKLNQDVTARRLFDNIIRYAATYKRTVLPTSFTLNTPILTKALNELGVSNTHASDPTTALKENPSSILVVEGTTQNINALLAQPDLLQKSYQAGGWIIILNVTPDSLPAFNKLVGYNHILRKFRQERVRFPAVRNPLTSGLTQRDVVMSSGRRIQNYTRDEWPTDDAFDYILDLNDIAPFAKFPPPAYWNDPNTTGPGNDTWPLNMVNGYKRDTHWRMIFSIHLNNNDPTNWTLKLPQEEKIKEIRISPNAIYHKIKAYDISFNQDPSTKKHFDVDPQSEQQTLTFDPPIPAKNIQIHITDWLESGSADVIGIDNMEIIVERPPTFNAQVKSMLNIGGLVNYPRKNGGIILSQYVFRQQESNPVNYQKKKTVLATLLRNLGAPFGGSSTPIAGFNLRYLPISLENFANLYLTKKQGWPTPQGDLAGLPKGEKAFAGVRYNIRDFSTSPLESGVTLKHPRLKSNANSTSIKAIPLGKTCDSLFFLHTFIQTQKWGSKRNQPEPPTLFTYTIHYQNGKKENIEITLGKQVANWLQPTPKSLPNASLAWTGNTQGTPDKATVYQLQWNNPHPKQPIKHIELKYATNGEKWGAPVLLGITAARVKK